MGDRYSFSVQGQSHAQSQAQNHVGIQAGPRRHRRLADAGVRRGGRPSGRCACGRPAAAATGTITEFRPAGFSQTATSDPLGITTGPDGNLWFTDAGASMIATINPSGAGLAEFKTNTGAASPVAITEGPDNRIWFTERSG